MQTNNSEKREYKRYWQVKRYYQWFGSVQSALIKDQMSLGKTWKRQPELLRHTKTGILLLTVLSVLKVPQSFTEPCGKDDLHLFWVSSSTLKAKYLQCSQGIVREGDTVTSGNWPRRGSDTLRMVSVRHSHTCIVAFTCAEQRKCVQIT